MKMYKFKLHDIALCNIVAPHVSGQEVWNWYANLALFPTGGRVAERSKALV